MGQIAARDLVETAPGGSTIVVADVSGQAAARVARTLPRRVPVRHVDADATRPRDLARLLRTIGAFAIINATHHRLNLLVMDAALDAGVHYCDLGGLFHQTRRQLRRHAEWKRADRLALLGIGAAPGIVNVLARSAADAMDTVREIHIAVAGIDRTSGRPPTPFGVSYSVRTLFEEASEPAAVFTGGRLRFAPPLSGAQEIRFPRPVGRQTPAFTLHSEIATLPDRYRDKGLRECTFRIALPATAVERLTFLRDAGLLSSTPIQMGRSTIDPRECVTRLFERNAPRPWRGVPVEHEILRVVVRGRRGSAVVEETVDCHVRGIRRWRAGIDVDTGCPPSIAMQMLARGDITARGVVAPEGAIPFDAFAAELRRRGMTIRRRVRTVSTTRSAAR
jgi:saccharopine dehydrogenase-like NADP-dependent oxidoreductase